MSESIEKMKIHRPRKRIYEMFQEEVSVTEELQESVAAMEISATEAAVAVVEVEVEERDGDLLEIFQEDTPGAEALGEPAAVKELSAMEIAAMEFAAESAVLQEPADVKELSAMEIAIMELAAEAAAKKAASATDHGEVSDGLYGEESLENGEDEMFRSAMTTVYTYSAMSAATGLIPFPLVDMAGFMATQLLMLKKLSKLYNIPFDSQRSKSSIAILASGINSAYLAASSSKLVPFIGAFSIAAMPAVNGALSYAVGRVFIQHFASGGTFLDFDPEKVRGYFEEQYRAGKRSGSEKSPF